MEEEQNLEQYEELEEEDFAGVSAEEFSEFLEIYQNHIESQEARYELIIGKLSAGSEALQSDSLTESDKTFLMTMTEEQGAEVEEIPAEYAQVSSSRKCGSATKFSRL